MTMTNSKHLKEQTQKPQKRVGDIIEEKTHYRACVDEGVRNRMVQAAIKSAAADMKATDPWFNRQMRLAVSSRKAIASPYTAIEEFGASALQEVLFSLAMLFIDSGLSDEAIDRIWQ